MIKNHLICDSTQGKKGTQGTKKHFFTRTKELIHN
jgi:hypothetical protein